MNYRYNKLAELLHTLKKPRDRWKNQAPVTWLPILIRLIQSSTGFTIKKQEKIFTICLVIFIRKQQKNMKLCNSSSPFYCVAEKRICFLLLRPQKGIICNIGKKNFFFFFPVFRELKTAVREAKKQPQL